MKTYKEYQLRALIRLEEEIHPTYIDIRWAKVLVDVIYIPPSKGK
jgi:hypothetical protein